MRRLPVFAELASPSTPAASAGVVGCVTPVPIGPLGSPIDAALRRSNRERVLEARVAMLKQRLTQALRENELLKAVPVEARGALCALVVGSVNVRRTASDLSDCPTALDLCGVDEESPPISRAPSRCTAAGDGACAPAGDAPALVEALRQGVRKRGGRGRGGKGKKADFGEAEKVSVY
jgi:hypothetical protein